MDLHRGASLSPITACKSHRASRIPSNHAQLTVVSILTVFFLTVTIILHCCFGLNPAFNLGLNTCLFVLWGMGFGMLAWWMWGTLTHYCDVLNWNDSTGIMVCRIYKALFTFSLLGLYVLAPTSTPSLNPWPSTNPLTPQERHY